LRAKPGYLTKIIVRIDWNSGPDKEKVYLKHSERYFSKYAGKALLTHSRKVGIEVDIGLGRLDEMVQKYY